jgi:hypothetical protein
MRPFSFIVAPWASEIMLADRYRDLGGALQVRLSYVPCYSGPQPERRQGRPGAHDDCARNLSPMWIELGQDKWLQPYWQTQSPLQAVGPCLCPDSRTSCHHRGAPDAHCTTPPGTNLPARDLSCGGRGLRWLFQCMAERFQAAPEHLYVRCCQLIHTGPIAWSQTERVTTCFP